MMRRWLLITGGAGFALSVGLWAASLWMVTWRNPRSNMWVAGARRGMLMVGNGGSYTRTGWTAMPLRWRMEWWPYDGRFVQMEGGFRVLVPLWMPTLVSGGALLAGWRLGRKGRPGFCDGCGYDLEGLGGGCPECGRSGAARR